MDIQRSSEVSFLVTSITNKKRLLGLCHTVLGVEV